MKEIISLQNYMINELLAKSAVIGESPKGQREVFIATATGIFLEAIWRYTPPCDYEETLRGALDRLSNGLKNYRENPIMGGKE